MTGKILVIGDIHIGVNKNNVDFFETTLEYADWVCKLCEEHSIQTIVQLGDVFHSREMIHLPAMACAYEFFRRLTKYDIHVIVGNHDCLYNDTSSVHSLMLLQNWPNITIHSKVDTLNDITFCGWGTTMADIPKKQRVIFGHFDIQGFSMSTTKVAEHGLVASELMDRCQLLMTGHYHKPQIRSYQKRRLVYTGSAFQLNWGESGERKYAYVLDLDTLAFTLVENKLSPQFVYITGEHDYRYVPNNFVSVELNGPEEFTKIVANLTSMGARNVRTTLRQLTLPDVVDRGTIADTVPEKMGEQTTVDRAIDEYVEALVGVTDTDQEKLREQLKAFYNRCI